MTGVSATPRARCREPTATATSMAARCHSSPPPTTTTIPAISRGGPTQGGQQPNHRNSSPGRITPGRSMGVSSTSTTQRNQLTATNPNPSSIGWPAPSTAAWWRRSPITMLPSINANGVIENPENSDKLAQRNLQVTTSGNPGFPATHRVPQTIDVRPSPPAQSTDPFSILSYPDEIMIDWGKTPLGSVASIYWPAVSAASVLTTGGAALSRADARGGGRQHHPMSSRKPGNLYSDSRRRRRQLRRTADSRSARTRSDTAMSSTSSCAASRPRQVAFHPVTQLRRRTPGRKLRFRLTGRDAAVPAPKLSAKAR